MDTASESTPPDLPEDLLAHAAWVRRLAARLVRDAGQVDDLVQQTWLEALRSPRRHGRAGLRSWLAVVVRHAAARLGRAHGRREAHEDAFRATHDPEDLTAPAADHLVERAARQRDVADEVLRLDEPFRAVVLLRFFDDLPPRGIAARLGIPVATVRSRLQRGMERLRGRLETRYGGEGAWATALLPLLRAPGALEGVLPAAARPLAGSVPDPIWRTLVSAQTIFSTKPVAAVAAGTVLFLLAAACAVFAAGVFETGRPAGEPLALATRAEDGMPAGTPAQEPGASEAVGAARSAPERGPRPARTEAGAAEDALQARIAAAEATGLHVETGRVVDVLGRPVADALLSWRTPRSPWWADSRDRWVNDGTDSLRADPDTMDRLHRAGAAERARFFARFGDPDGWRTLLLQETAEGRAVRTDADGRFVLGIAPGLVDGGELQVLDRAHRLLAQGRADGARPGAADPREARGSEATAEPGGGPNADRSLDRASSPRTRDADLRPGERVFVVAPAVELAGTVVDAGATRLPGVHVRVALPDLEDLPGLRGLDDLRIERPEGCDTDGTGSWFLRGVPTGIPGARLVADDGAGGRTAVDVPAADRDELELVLEGGTVRVPIRFRGLVLAPDGNGVPDARVLFGRARSRTGPDGRFELELLPPARGSEATEPLLVHARGWSPWSDHDFGRRLTDGAAREQELTIRLDGRAARIRGVVVDSGGAPVGGALIDLFDPTLPGFSFSSLESWTAGRSEPVVSGPDGSFEMPGLRRGRSYRLRVLHLDRRISHVTEPLAPEAPELQAAASAGVRTIRLPSDPHHALVRGTVVDTRGRPVAGAEVRLGVTLRTTRGGGWLGHTLPPVVTDEDGRFVLRDVPRRHAFLEVAVAASVPATAAGSAGMRRQRHAVEEVDDAGIVVLRVRRLAAFRVGAESFRAADGLRVLDRWGRVLELAGTARGGPRVELLRRPAGAPFPTAWVDETAASVVFYADDGRTELGRRDLVLSPERPTVVR